MTQADSVHSTPPTNTPVDTTRRHFLTVAAGVAAAVAVSPAAAAIAAPDPIFAAIDAFHTADAACVARVDGDIPDEVADRCSEAYDVVLRTCPTTPAGLAALTSWARERADWLCANFSVMHAANLCTLTAAIDNATRGMAGLQPWSPGATCADHPDAELLSLAARYEPLVDNYYSARAVWAPLLTQVHAEVNEKLGPLKPPLSKAANKKRQALFRKVSKGLGLDEADDRLAATHEKMEAMEDRINELPCRSIEGLRAKALVAFREIAPSGADDGSFSFDDAYPFEQLFSAVANVCGLTEKVKATGYHLPVGDSDVEVDEA